MSDASEIERFVKDPGLLVELCREVIDEIDAGTDETDAAERETQLREIAKAIERLEKAGVSVPDVLRAEKTRLAASLAVHASATQALTQLADEFASIAKELKARLGQAPTPTGPKPRARRSRAPRTDKTVLREQIIQPSGNLAAAHGYRRSSKRWATSSTASCCLATPNGVRQPTNTSGRTTPSGSATA